MIFNSYTFILFIVIVFIVFYILKDKEIKGQSLKKIWLFVASVFFYSYGCIEGLAILIISILFNYFIGNKMIKIEGKKRKGIFVFAVIMNLLTLACFKYTTFLVNSINEIAKTDFNFKNIILPLGISFYTFTQLAYIIDVYKGFKEKYSIWDYSLFVMIFPSVTSGPITDHKEMIPQFSKKSKLNFENIAIGLSFFIIGLFKKVIIADKIAPWVNEVFNNTASITFLEGWIGALGYTLELFFDFSGYSDMAIGIGKIFNIDFPINFNSPYQANSITEFWRRWHISLSTWIKNYIYIPLGGNRKGEIKKYRNLLVTMILCGIWHGAGLNFIFWGALHGIYQIINNLWKKTKIVIPKFIARLLTFCSVMIGWIFFRATTMKDGVKVLIKLFDFKSITINQMYSNKLGVLKNFGIKFDNIVSSFSVPKAMTIIILLLILLMFIPSSQKIVYKFVRSKNKSIIFAIILGIIATFALFNLGQSQSAFIYYNF